MEGTKPRFGDYNNDGELTLRDLVAAYQKYKREAIRSWWMYAIAFMFIGGFLVYRAISTPETYKARMTFMLSEDDGNPFGAFGGVLGTLGLGRRGGRFNLDKIVELARSRRIVKEVLLWKEQEYLGNRLIEEYELDEPWAEADSLMEGFRFTRDSVKYFTVQERKALLALYGLLMGGEDSDGLATAGYDDVSSILYITYETTNETLSIDLARTHFERLKEFYIDQAIARQKATFDLMREKVDSIQGELTSADLDLATFTDRSQSMWSNVDKLKGERLRREIMKLAAMQAEAVKNMELAEFSLKSARPVIQELDIPISPIEPNKPSLLKAIVLGGFIAFVLTTIFIVVRSMIKDAMEYHRQSQLTA